MLQNIHTKAVATTIISLLCLQSCHATCSLTSSAVVSALLPLHSGANCSTLQLRGLQQLAALKAAVNEVNNEMKAQDGLSLGLLVQDTCGTADGAMKAALRSLVEAQQSCTNPPLYLGMIGPEDPEALSRVKSVSKVFNATHVVPSYHNGYKEAEDNSVFYVSTEANKEQAQSVLTLLHKLKWQSLSMAFEEPMTELAEFLIRGIKEDASLCLKGSVSRLSLEAPVPNIFSGSKDGVLVLADGHEMAAKVLRVYRGLSTPLVLLVRTVGLESWQVPRSATKLYLLQHVSASTEGVPDTMNITLKTEYESQRQDEFQNVHCRDVINAADCALESSTQDNLLDNTDVSVGGMSNGIRLISAALRTVHRSRCMSGVTAIFGMCAKLLAMPTVEWRNTLRRANINHRVRFLMELPTSFHVFSRDNDAGHLVKVASLISGNLQEFNDYSWPVIQHSSNSSACGDAPVISLPPSSLPAPPTYEDDSFFTLKDLYTSEYSFYELIGMICAVGFIMFGVMVVIIYVIYNSLVEKTEKESTGGSMETVRSSRPPRRSLRDTFRRNSVARSSNRS